MSNVLLKVENISKRYCRDPKRAVAHALRDIGDDIRGSLRPDSGRESDPGLRPGEFWALRDVNLEVSAGEVVGLIGHNGAGKSSLIKIIGGILRPTSGRVVLHTERTVVMDHQGGLNPVQTGRENIANQLALYGIKAVDIARATDEVVEYSELAEFADTAVGTYSLGMRLRLALAIYSQIEPDLIIVDEALNGGDIRFQKKFRRFLIDRVDSGGAILVASHQLFAIQSMCGRCVLMNEGRVHSEGPTQEVIHTYTTLSTQKDKATPLAKSIMGGSATFEGVRIDDVEIVSGDGDAVYPGSSVTFRIRCRCSEAVHPVLCGLEIGGAGVFPLATILGGYDGPGYSLKSGPNEFVCRIDSLPLAAGAYQVCVSVITREGGIVLGMKGYEDDAVFLEVVSRLDSESNMAAYRNNVVHIDAHWAQSTQAPELAGSRSALHQAPREGFI